MLEMRVQVDLTMFRRAAARRVAEIEPALIDDVNTVAHAVQKALRQEMLRVFDHPKPYTIDGVRVYEASHRDSGDPSALVFLSDNVGASLELEIRGGTRVAGDYGTTRLGPIVPGPAAARDQFGGLSPSYLCQVEQEKDVAWVTLKAGQPPALVQTLPGGRPAVIALIVEETHYHERFDFYDIAKKGVQANLNAAVLQALD